MRVGLKGFASDELEPRTSDGELVADLLANAGAQFESGSRRSHDSSSSRSATFSAGPNAGVGAAAHHVAVSSSSEGASSAAQGQSGR